MACSIIPVDLTIEVLDVNDQLATYDQIQIHRSINGSTGTYQEITKTDTRIDLVEDQTIYEYEDENGSPSYWYKFRYYNSSTLAVSAFSSPFPGGQDPALDILSIEELKTLFLFGLDLTDDTGKPFPDSMYAHFIIAATESLERKLDVPIRPLTLTDERHDYFREDYEKYIFFETDHFPIIAVDAIRLVLPGEQVVQTFEQDWIHVQRESGQVQLLPGTGTAGTILLGASGAWIPLVYGSNRYIPDVFRIDYRAGFGRNNDPDAVSPSAPKLDKVSVDIKDTIGKIASFGPLNIAGDLLGGAGIASQSIGIDGLSQSFNTTSSATNAGYGARLIQYQRELKETIPTLQRWYKGLRLRVA